jgi:hypothetical protein
MYQLLSKYRFLAFYLLLGRVASYLQFVTTNCLINNLNVESYIVLLYLNALKGDEYWISPQEIRIEKKADLDTKIDFL